MKFLNRLSDLFLTKDRIQAIGDMAVKEAISRGQEFPVDAYSFPDDVKQFREIIFSFDSRQHASLLEIFGILLGKDLGKVKGDCTLVRGTFVVPLENPNHHNYPLGQPCMMFSRATGRAYRIDGTLGNYLPVGVRYATEAEIREFCRKNPTLVKNFLKEIQ